MTEREDAEALFLAHLPFIDRAVDAVGRVLGLRGDDAEEFASWARERLWDGDYQVLRKWRGESRLTTYLTTVIATLGREFRVRRWGRWRPSAAARRAGPLAVRLETLVYRDGMHLAEVAELLRTRGETDHDDGALAALLAEVPHRARPRRHNDREVPLDGFAAAAAADDALCADEQDAERCATYDVLFAALRRLGALEQVVLRMHFFEGRSLADVARALAVPQKPLYRLKDRALGALARELEASGVTRERVRALLAGALPTHTETRDADAAGDTGELWLSNGTCDSTLATENGASRAPDPRATRDS